MDYLQRYSEEVKAKSLNLPPALESLDEIKTLALDLLKLKKTARLGEIDIVDPKILEWLSELFKQYKEYNDTHLPPDYHDSPEITQEEANKLFSILRDSVKLKVSV